MTTSRSRTDVGAARGVGQAGIRAESLAARATAVALSYSERDVAPRVVAKGSGPIAEQIIRRAREAGVFVHESPELVGLLAKLDLDAHIPPTLYFAIAEILAWIYAIERGGAPGPTALAPHHPLHPPSKS